MTVKTGRPKKEPKVQVRINAKLMKPIGVIAAAADMSRDDWISKQLAKLVEKEIKPALDAHARASNII